MSYVYVIDQQMNTDKMFSEIIIFFTNMFWSSL